MLKKWLAGVSVAAVGGIAAGVVLKWTPMISFWNASKAAASWFWDVIAFKVPIPLSLLIILIAPYVFLAVVLFLSSRSSRVETPEEQKPEVKLDPAQHYQCDEILGVLWVWRWEYRGNDTSGPDAIRPLCPRKSCRSDLELVGYSQVLYCNRCGFRLSVDGHNLIPTVEREIISRARTGDWTNALQRLSQLNEFNP